MKINNFKKKIIAIIPARGGSKRLPGKNIKIMAGKPLIAHTIIWALKSKYINKTIVSTDEKKIAEISDKYGAEVINRPKHIATDNAKTIDVILHVLKVLEKEKYIPEIVVLLQPTSPLRTVSDIDNAIELFLKNKNNCEIVMSICDLGKSIYWFLKKERKYFKLLFGHKYIVGRSQNLKKIYIPNGAIYITTPKILKKYKAIPFSKILPYFMSKEKSIDIDDKFDFLIAESIIKNN